MNEYEIEQEIERLTAAYRDNLRRYEETEQNPYYLSKAKMALEHAAMLSQVRQGICLQRIAYALEVKP